jgi:MFS family permease
MQAAVSLSQQTPAAIGPMLTSALGLSGVELGLLTSAVWGGMLIGMLPFGLLVDRYGERSVMLAGGTVLTVFMLLASRATSFPVLFAALVPAAIGISSASPGGARALAAWFEPRLRGTAMGIRQTGVTAAGVLTAITLPPIGLAFGWQAAFVTVAVLALAGTLAFVLFYREPPVAAPGERRPFDVAALARSRTWLAATAYGWVFMGALGSVVAYLAVSLNQDGGLRPVLAGWLLALLQLGGMAGRIGFGVLSDRAGSRGMAMTLSAGLAVVACLAMAASDLGRAGVPALAAIAFLLGLSCMGWNGLHITLSAEVVPAEHAATAVGAGLTISFVGMFVVPPVFGLIADRAGSYAPSWLALAAWSALGLAVSLTVRDGRRRNALDRRVA